MPQRAGLSTDSTNKQTRQPSHQPQPSSRSQQRAPPQPLGALPQPLGALPASMLTISHPARAHIPSPKLAASSRASLIMSPTRQEAHRVVQDSQGWAGREHAPEVIADCPIATRAHVEMLLHESEHHWADAK